MLLGLELELLRHVLDQLGQREGFEVKLPALALQHRQLEQLGDQLVQALAVFGGEVQVVAPFGLAEFALLDHQGLQVTLQRGQRRAQLVGDVGDQLAPGRVGVTQLADLLDDALGHPLDRDAELVDLVAARAPAPGAEAHGGLELALLEGLHRRAQAAQAPGQPVERHQPGDQRERQAGQADADRQAQDVAVLDHPGDRIESLAAEHHVEVAGQPVTLAQLRRREHLAPLRVAWIVAADREFFGAVDEGPDRRQGDPAAPYPPGRRVVGQDRALGVDQVELDARVDHHQRMEQPLEGGLVDRPALQQWGLGDDAGGERLVELLVDLLQVEPGGGHGEGDVDQADRRDQREQRRHQLAVERAGHGITGSADAERAPARTPARPPTTLCSGSPAGRPAAPPGHP